MSRRFFWPWQLSAHPFIVLDALLDLRLREFQLDSMIEKPAVFDVLFCTVLKLIGYDPTSNIGSNIYQHVWDDKIRVSIVLKSIVRKGTVSSFTCCSGCDGKFSTTFILDLDTTRDIVCSKELIAHWVDLIVQRVLLHLPMPRPRRGCLILCGEDFGSQYAKALFRYDLMILQSQRYPCVKNELFISTVLVDKKNSPNIYTFITTSKGAKPELVEYVVVENESKEVIMSTIQLFFGMGYIFPMCIFNGHGMPGTGELVVRAGHKNRSSRSDAYDTISLAEISHRVSSLYENYTIASGGLAEALFVLNSPHSHLFQNIPESTGLVPSRTENRTIFPGATAPAQSKRLQIIPLTTEAIPTAPRCGCIKFFRRNPMLLPAQYHDLLGGLVDSDAALPGMKVFITQFSRSMCAFKSPPLIAMESTAIVKSGVYVFRCGDDGAGLVRVIYDHHVRHAVIVDGGTDAKAFYENVWKGFILLYASTYDVLLASKDGRCTSGIYALFNSKSFETRQSPASAVGSLPLCVRLFTKCTTLESGGGLVHPMYSDLDIIISRATSAGVEIVRNVSQGELLYHRRHRSLHAKYGIRVEAMAPVVATPFVASSVCSLPTSAPCSPLRGDAGPRVKEQLGLSADMSELDISLISSLVSMYTATSLNTPAPNPPVFTRAAVHPAAVRDPAPAQMSVRAWTKIVQVHEPGILQCTIKRSNKKKLPAHSSFDFAWVEFLPFPSDNV